MTVSLASLITTMTKAQIYSYAIGIANAIGLPVSSWQAGDPTRAQFHTESEFLATLEDVVVGYIKSRFLDLATGQWLKVKAEQDYGVTVPEASFATTDVVLTNNGGGFYPDIQAGDLTFKSTISGKTYRNTTGGTLASGPATTLTVTVVADEAGSDSSAGAGEIDDMVTALTGVTCSNAVAAIGVDEQDEEVTRQQCRDRLGRLSPNGAKEAYGDVAIDSTLTGTSGITRHREYGDSDTGDVTVYLAGPSGAVSSGDRTLVETAILKWATPLCITPSVVSVANVTVAITYSLWIYKSCNKTAAEIAVDIEAALGAMLARRPLGGDIIAPATSGKLYLSMIESTIRGVFPQAFRVVVSAPSGDTDLTNGQVAALGTVTPTIILVVDP